jgi:hypothetical protein
MSQTHTRELDSILDTFRIWQQRQAKTASTNRLQRWKKCLRHYAGSTSAMVTLEKKARRTGTPQKIKFDLADPEPSVNRQQGGAGSLHVASPAKL